jgi:hypothetical protein
MKVKKSTALLALLCTAILLLSCGGRDQERPPVTPEEGGDASGYFTDVYDALEALAEMTADVKTEWDRKSGISRSEWRLSEDAVDRYYHPLFKTDYYYYDDTLDEEVTAADPLTRIFLEEWGEYQYLSETTDTAGGMTPELSSEVDALVASAAVLLAGTPPIHRDMVRRIVGLRYRTLLLGAGVNPEGTP